MLVVNGEVLLQVIVGELDELGIVFSELCELVGIKLRDFVLDLLYYKLLV